MLRLKCALIILVLLQCVTCDMDEDSSDAANRAERSAFRGNRQDRRRWFTFMRYSRRGQVLCFDVIGCYRSFLTWVQPDQPEDLDTAFLLYTRENPTVPQQLRYDNPDTVVTTNFDPKKPTKVIIHGFRSTAKLPLPSMKCKDAFLEVGDYNVILVDWTQGAASDRYFKGIANAELVARLLAHLIEAMVMDAGASPKNIHLVGSSLGAHLAGFVGEALKLKGMTLGQITGLDPAGFVFQTKQVPFGTGLDKSDAEFVDVIHSFGGLLSRGKLGTWMSLGHVDFFPNGGSEQAGCWDMDMHSGLDVIRAISTGRLMACSHARASELYIESITSKCNFVGFPCHSLQDFEKDFLHGYCFDCYGAFCGVMGPRARESMAKGSLYLVTRATSPYCGDQLQAVVDISERTAPTRGKLSLHIISNGTYTTFPMNSGSREVIQGPRFMTSVIATDFGTVSQAGNSSTILADLEFSPDFILRMFGRNTIYFNSVSIKDQNGNSWYYCANESALKDSKYSPTNSIRIEMKQDPC